MSSDYRLDVFEIDLDTAESILAVDVDVTKEQFSLSYGGFSLSYPLASKNVRVLLGVFYDSSKFARLDSLSAVAGVSVVFVIHTFSGSDIVPLRVGVTYFPNPESYYYSSAIVVDGYPVYFPPQQEGLFELYELEKALSRIFEMYEAVSDVISKP